MEFVDRPSGTVTFLLTDIEGSTRLWQGDSEAMAKALARHDSVIEEVVTAHGGRMLKSRGEGDSTFSVFDAPTAGVIAAAALQQALGGELWPGEVDLRVRAALHTGEAEFRSDDFFGPVVNRCARLRSIAHGGQTICSRTTAELVVDHLPGDLSLRDLGTHRLRDLERAEQVFQVSRRQDLHEFPPLRSLDMGRPNLPTPLTSFVGRRDEVALVTGRLESDRLVTLTGVGGVGKTRLAVATAEAIGPRFVDGVAWLELAPLSEAADVAVAVADHLGVAPPPGVPVLSAVCDALRHQRLLVVLDNCEQVRVGAADLAAALMSECPLVAVLATSRQRLGLDGEHVLAVTPLPVDGLDSPAVGLLADRIDDTAALGDGEDLALIARRLDGLPLALELAAARCRSLGVGEVALRLDQALGLLSDPSRPPGRHQAMDAALEWSFRLLDEAERRVLACLSVFAAPFSLAGAEAVAAPHQGGRSGVAEAVSSLVDKSLVVQRTGSFRLLETTRQFSARQLDASGAGRGAEEAHGRYVAEQVRAIHPGLRGPEEARWVVALDAFWPDVRAAVRRGLERGDAGTVAEILAHLTMEIFYRRPEAFPWITEAVERWGDVEGPHRHELLAAGSYVAFSRQEMVRAVELGEKAMAADPAPGTAVDCVPEFATLGSYFFSGQTERGEALCRRLVNRSGPLDISAAALATQAIGEAQLGRDSAPATAVAALEAAEAIGNPTLIGYALGPRAMTVAATDPGLAASLLHRQVTTAASVRNHWLLGLGTGFLAMVGSQGGASDEAVHTCLDAALSLQRAGWSTHGWWTAWYLPGLLFDLGRREAAALALGACEASGVAPPRGAGLPKALEALAVRDGDLDLQRQRRLGARLDLAELVRVIERPPST